MPNKKIEAIDVNPILSNISTSTKLQEFPLEGVGKYTDNLKFIYLFNQKHKQARNELEKMISDHKTFTDPFQQYSIDYDINILKLALKENDVELYKKLAKEFSGLKSWKYERYPLSNKFY